MSLRALVGAIVYTMLTRPLAHSPRDQALNTGPGVYLTDMLDNTSFVPIQFCASTKVRSYDVHTVHYSRRPIELP